MSGTPSQSSDASFGIFVPTIGPPATGRNLLRIARAAERHDFDSLWAGEHIAFPVEMSDTYPFTCSGEPPETLHASEKLLSISESLAYLAGATSSISLGTNVCLAPLYHPADLIKRVFTLEVLTNGRFEFGVGLGWMPEEYDLLDVPFNERGARLDEFLEIFSRAREQKQLAFEGRFTSFEETGFRPAPAADRPPIWIGGKSGATFRRVAEFGDGWTIVRDSPAEISAAAARLENAWTDYDREGIPSIALARPFHVGSDQGQSSPLVGPVEKVQGDIRRYVDAGVTDFAFMFKTPDIDEQLEQMAHLADDVLGVS